MAPKKDMLDLLHQYIDVCNRAIASSKDRFPDGMILQASLGASQPAVAVNVLDDRPNPCAVLNVSLDGLTMSPLMGEAEKDKPYWCIPRSFLEQVAADPDTYIKEPVKLDWGWLDAGCAEPKEPVPGSAHADLDGTRLGAGKF